VTAGSPSITTTGSDISAVWRIHVAEAKIA
jgi:hypothetical protein